MSAANIARGLRPWMIVAIALMVLFVVAVTTPVGWAFMWLGFGLLFGILLHVPMIMMVVDCFGGGTSKWWLVVPGAFYGAGLAAFATGLVAAHTLEQHIQANERRAKIVFDPGRQVVIADEAAFYSTLASLMASYKLDVAYGDERLKRKVEGMYDGYWRHDVTQKSDKPCERFNFLTVERDRRTSPDICMTQERVGAPRQPSIRINTNSENTSWSAHRASIFWAEVVDEQHPYVSSIAGVGRIEIYPPIPFIAAGCDVGGCGVFPVTLPMYVNSARGKKENGANADAIAAALGLEPRTR